MFLSGTVVIGYASGSPDRVGMGGVGLEWFRLTIQESASVRAVLASFARCVNTALTLARVELGETSSIELMA